MNAHGAILPGTVRRSTTWTRLSRPKTSEPPDERRFSFVALGNDDAPETLFPGQQSGREDAFDRLQPAVEGQLAHEEQILRRLQADDVRGRRDGPGRSEGRRPAPSFRRSAGARLTVTLRDGNVVAAVLEGRLDPLLALPDGCVGQADDDEIGQAGADVDLDLDDVGFDAEEGGACGFEEHGRRK